MKRLLLYLVPGLLVTLPACKKQELYSPTPTVVSAPSHFPQMSHPVDNPLTLEGIELGRYLFYEKSLSGDGSMSCASCHLQSSSFSDPNQFSVGITGVLGSVQSMALINLGWEDHYFWDGRATSLEQQILEPVTNPIEMHQSWKEATKSLALNPKYPSRFLKAFGTPEPDSTLVARAIAQFLRTLVSGRSKFDVMYKFENGMPLSGPEQQIYSSIDIQEWAGYDLFRSLNGADCFHCHNGPLLRVKKFSNNGLDLSPDAGRFAVTGNAADWGKFKVPTLRNIALTAPYMHDGRFSSLEEVIEFYSTGVQSSATIDPLIEHANLGGVQLSSEEKILLKKFLLCLTDLDFIENAAYKNPH